jgi:hypothetical protein
MKGSRRLARLGGRPGQHRAKLGLPVVGGCNVDDDDELEGAATSEVDDMLA